MERMYRGADAPMKREHWQLVRNLWELWTVQPYANIYRPCSPVFMISFQTVFTFWCFHWSTFADTRRSIYIGFQHLRT